MSKHLLLVTVSVWLLSGCGSITIDAPKGNLPAAPSPVSVPVQIEITKSVYNRNCVITGGAAPITLTNFTTTPSGTQNLDILSTAVQLAPGSYT